MADAYFRRLFDQPSDTDPQRRIDSAAAKFSGPLLCSLLLIKLDLRSAGLQTPQQIVPCASRHEGGWSPPAIRTYEAAGSPIKQRYLRSFCRRWMHGPCMQLSRKDYLRKRPCTEPLGRKQEASAEGGEQECGVSGRPCVHKKYPVLPSGGRIVPSRELACDLEKGLFTN